VRPVYAAALALGLAACGGDGGGPQSRTVVIGVELPLTGNDGAEGLMALHAITLAVSDFHATPSGTRIRLQVRDTVGAPVADPHEDEGSDNPDEPRKGSASVRVFARNVHVVGVIGGLRPDVAAAEAPVAKTLRLPVVSPTFAVATDAWRVRHQPALFALGFRDVDEARAGATLAVLLGYRRVALLGDGGPVARTEDAAFTRFFRASGGTVVPINESARLPGAQAVFYKGPLERAALLLPFAASTVVLSPSERIRMTHRGYSAPIIGIPYERIEPVGRRSWFSGFVNDTWVREFRRRYGALPDEAALAAYDAFSVFVSALETAESSGTGDRGGITAALRTNPIVTLRGRGAFNAAGLLPMDAFRDLTVICGRVLEIRAIVPPPDRFRVSQTPRSAPQRCAQR
jgi:ABC-type branched-subunit amino acid transport system substrate-binding protein